MFLNSNDWSEIAFRLGLALLVGCLIGLNRQRRGRPAGMRTFMLVSIGAALSDCSYKLRKLLILNLCKQK